MMTLVDSHVLLGVIQDDDQWADWSATELAAAFDSGPVIINAITFAEVALAFDTQQQLETYFQPSEYERRELPWSAARSVAKAFLTYRQRGGARTTPLPDFYIGAHAASENLTLLTRDRARFSTYFPEVRLIAPE